jgi:hypothetical protein
LHKRIESKRDELKTNHNLFSKSAVHHLHVLKSQKSPNIPDGPLPPNIIKVELEIAARPASHRLLGVRGASRY